MAYFYALDMFTEIRHAATWLATESGWAQSKCSAICSGKLWRHHYFWAVWALCLKPDVHIFENYVFHFFKYIPVFDFVEQCACKHFYLKISSKCDVFITMLFYSSTGISYGSSAVLHSVHFDTFYSRKSRDNDRCGHFCGGVFPSWIQHWGRCLHSMLIFRRGIVVICLHKSSLFSTLKLETMQ